MDLNDKAISEKHWFFSRLQIFGQFGESYIFKCDHAISSNHSGVVFYGCVQQNLPNYALPSLYTLVTGIGLAI